MRDINGIRSGDEFLEDWAGKLSVVNGTWVAGACVCVRRQNEGNMRQHWELT